MKVSIVLLCFAFSWVYASDSEEETIWSTVKDPLIPATRIIGGQPAKPRQYPYQVGLFILVNETESNWCGGSLISRIWILTAAHCTDESTTITAYLGSNIRQDGTIAVVTRKIIHSGWNPKTLANDISLLRIPAVTLGATIGTVKLPPIARSYPSYINQTVIASGWGTTSDNEINLPDVLQYAELKISNNSVCSQLFSDTKASNICIETPKKASTCGGDSGGPLVLKSSRLLVGITSFGAESGCGKGFPIVFTRVTSFRTWIKKTCNV